MATTSTAKLRDLLRVQPGADVDLAKFDPEATFGWDKKAGEAATGSSSLDWPSCRTGYGPSRSGRS